MTQKTLNGFLLEDLADLLDQPLHASAYKAIASATYLTDISIVWQRRVFNKIFGMYSIGWGFDVNPDHLVVSDGEKTSSNKSTCEASIRGNFWFKYIDNDGTEKKSSFLVTGAHKDSSNNPAYAMKGAFTNAIGFGGSCLGWQESVYMGIRSHKDPKASAPARKIFKSLEEMMSLKVSDEDGAVAEPKKETEAIPPVKPIEEKPVTTYWNCSHCPSNYIVDTPCVAPSCSKCNMDMIQTVDKKTMLARSEQITKELAAKEKETPAKPITTDIEVVEEELVMKYPVCIECGWTEPVNEVPNICKGCGLIDPKFSMQANLETAKKAGQGFKDIVANRNKEISTEALLEEAKKLAGNDRGLLLRTLSDVAGTSIRSYAKATQEHYRGAIEILSKSNAEVKPTAKEETKPLPVNLPKTDKIRAIFKAGFPVMGSMPKLIEKISDRVGRKIVSSNELNSDELDDLYTSWVTKGEII